ncbi:MAG: hypothetical protein ACI4L9_06570 [Candidatus Coproplasma sp.]
MARKSKQQSGTITLAAASEELATRLVKIYKDQTFIRVGKDLAEMLFKTGVEAGAVLSGIAELSSRQAKIDAANQAIIKLNQVSYIANVMCKAELYKPAQVKPLVEYVNHVVKALKELLSTVPDVQRVIRINSPVGVVDANPVKQQAMVLLNAPVTDYGASDNVQAYKASPEDGFNEPA